MAILENRVILNRIDDVPRNCAWKARDRSWDEVNTIVVHQNGMWPSMLQILTAHYTTLPILTQAYSTGLTVQNGSNHMRVCTHKVIGASC